MNRTQKRVSEAVYKYCEEKIERLGKLKELANTVPLPELPDEIYSVYRSDNIMFMVGFSPENVRLFFGKMKKAGWDPTSKVEDVISTLKSGDSSSELVAWYHDDEDINTPVYAYFNIGATGSNCKRVKIGTKTVEENVFEVVCNEGIEEAAD